MNRFNKTNSNINTVENLETNQLTTNNISSNSGNSLIITPSLYPNDYPDPKSNIGLLVNCPYLKTASGVITSLPFVMCLYDKENGSYLNLECLTHFIYPFSSTEAHAIISAQTPNHGWGNTWVGSNYGTVILSGDFTNFSEADLPTGYSVYNNGSLYVTGNVSSGALNLSNLTLSSSGCINAVTTSATSFSSSNTWITPAGSYTSNISKNATILSSGCGFTINGSTTQQYIIMVSLSVLGTSGSNLSCGISKNSATPTIINNIAITGVTYQPITLNGILSLASTDTISLLVNNLSNTDSITVQTINFSLIPTNFQ